MSPSEKFAQPLLSWSTEPVTTDDGSSQVKLTLTHEETTESMGTTRETVSRLFSEFKKKRLTQLRGATLGDSRPRGARQDRAVSGFSVLEPSGMVSVL